MEKSKDNKGGEELDKFKRRLIRAVARLLLHEKKSEEEIWKELKKETGCDCELLWTRMRALTIKKLDCLLAANDCIKAVPKGARMTPTDWLLFDLVLVHQKIDLIGQKKTKDKEESPVLAELYELVKMFKIEFLSGDKLAEAWSLATMYYSKNKGHHCSPMLLQRRWYQLKEFTRFKFYDFWYAYRGNLTRVNFAEPYRPSVLQTEIAKTFKLLVTKPFPEWEELIEQRLVTMPDEFERKIKERDAIMRPVRRSTEDGPDLVMIEPRIETIDLRLEPDDNTAEDDNSSSSSSNIPLVRVKQEPQDDMDIDETQVQLPKKSLYEVVLESTALENEQLDSMNASDFDPENDDIDIENIEEIGREEEESVLPQIRSVFGNVNDTSLLANIDEDRVYGNVEYTEVRGTVDDTSDVNVGDTNVCNDKSNDEETGDGNIADDASARDNENETDARDNIDQNSARNNNAVIEVSSDDIEADFSVNIDNESENVGETSPGGGVSYDINEISDEDDISGYVDATNDTGNADKTSATDNVEETSIARNVDETDVFGNVTCKVIETSVTGAIEVVGDVYKTNVNSEAEVVGAAVETNVTSIVEVIGAVGKTNITSGSEAVSNEVETRVSGKVELISNVNETSGTDNIEDITNLVPSENKPIINTETTYPTIVAALSAKVQDTTAANTEAEAIKDVEIIESTSDPVVIIDSDEEDNHNVDALVIDKTVPKSTEEDIIVPKDTKDQPMEVDSTPEVLEDSFTEPLKVKNVMKNDVNAEESAEKNEEIDIKPDIKSLEELVFADDGIVYVDEEGPTETKIKRDEDENEDNPNIDAKLLMCPIVYTTRLDDMGLFKTQIDHMYVNDIHLLDAIIKKSQPIKKEPETDSQDRFENVTVNYCGETIESVTVNDSKKTIEYVQKNVDENVVASDSSILIKKELEYDQSESIKDVPKDNIVPIEDNPKDNVVPIENVPKDNIAPIEDVRKQNVVPVEFIQQNDNNITSDDDDCEEDRIDESLKVKPTSYLLQKPRSRRYHSIQLCKNPDFNTRLRRLSVGFFGSARNRVLIKSCKPLTIDLSKAFESKLISGRLYLKPVDHNVVTEIIDDSESHNVSVVPSAMPAQSLIDNSRVADILPMLRQCLEASKHVTTTEAVGQTSERNRVINLPDITEIRRINQRLLTAEVTPIQVQNNQPQVPVTIVTSSNTPTYPAQKTSTVAETDTDLRSIVSEATDARGPPKLLDIPDDPRATKPTEYHSAKPNVGSRPRPSLLQGLSLRMLNGKRLILPKPVIWKPRQLRPEIPWLSKNYDANINSKKEDTLLTLDALNKMLFLLTDKLEPEVVAVKKPKPKVKRKISGPQTKQRGRPRLTPDDSHYMVLLRKADEADEELNSSSEVSSKCHKPKINIKSATNYPPVKEQNRTEQSTKKIRYCCWARQRMLQLLFSRESIPLHDCQGECVCCCSILLNDYILHDQTVKSTELPLIELQSLDKASAVSERTEFVKTGIQRPDRPSMDISIQVPDVETVHVLDVEVDHVLDVEKDQGSGAGTVPVPEDTPIIDVDATITESTTNTTTENEPIDIDALDSESDVPVAACEVSVTTTAQVEKLVPRGLEAPVNVISKRIIVSIPTTKNCNLSVSSQTIGKPAYLYPHNIRPDNQSGRVILTRALSKAGTQTTTSPPSIGNLLAIKKSQGPNKFKTNMPLPPILSKPFAPPKHFKEKMIFLNSKQISEKPSKSPVYLGKNKILLTTIKFPPNLKLFEEAKKALRSTLKLPDGVRLMLLSDGSIVYKTDPNVTVTGTELNELPAIIATVQARMAIHAAQEEALKNQKDGKESEVVDLIDDDDESTPNNNENNKTPLGTEVQTTEETTTVNSNDSRDDSLMNASNESEENRTDSNITSNVRETESNQNESADQYTVTEIQKDVQEASQNETLSASIEQDQSNPTSQTISPEQDDQPIPSSQTGRIDVHEVSSEQAQNQSEPFGQNVSIEVQDHLETAAQCVSFTPVQRPQESIIEPSKPKTKNILSDLMEMSGIFDEDISEIEETQQAETHAAQAAEQVVLTQASLMAALPAPVDVDPPAQEVVQPPVSASAGTTHVQPILIPNFNKDNPLTPRLRSPLGELSPITSLYELKYACSNKGVFFKLDFETGYLVPINVCMKPTIVKSKTGIRNIAPKSVIDLTEDDDKPVQKDTESLTSPNKRSLLLVNNSGDDGFTGPVKPVKMFKALKPSILQRLNQNKMSLESKNPTLNNVLGHKAKRKQFLRKINVNTDSVGTTDYGKHNNPMPVRRYVKKIKVTRNSINTFKVTDEADEPTPTTSHTAPYKEFATTILSNDDSSDDEPLAKIAKRKHENLNAPEENKNAPQSGTKYNELELPAVDVQLEAPVEKQREPELPASDVRLVAPIEKQNEPEFPSSDVEQDYMSVTDNGLVEPEAAVEKQTESEIPPADTESFCMSDNCDDSVDLEAPFEFESNEEDEDDRCILGV